jgi:hypothetical protein
VSVGLRKFRALVFEYIDAGSAGNPDSAYQIVDSGDADKAWWCSRALPSGHEVTTGMRPEHRLDAVFGFAAEVPVDVSHAIMIGDEAFIVRAVLTRDYGHDEVQVLAERQVELTLTASP